jgi:formylglycine-generating enzyme required for sulfatase activity
LSAEERGRLPVEYVRWSEVVAYCNARSELEGLTPAYMTNGIISLVPGATGYRLPTEAEWEYAARGGKNHDTYVYSGNDDPDAVAWYSDNSYSDRTHPVGGKAANSLGLYDMSGNVWEWCWDWYGSYGSEAQTDPMGALSGTTHIRRGGGWSNIAFGVRCADRLGSSASLQDYGLGLRLVRSQF